MHEVVRQYAEEQGQRAGELERTRTRHLEWYLRLAELAEPAWRGPQQGAWLDRLEQERDKRRAPRWNGCA